MAQLKFLLSIIANSLSPPPKKKIILTLCPKTTKQLGTKITKQTLLCETVISFCHILTALFSIGTVGLHGPSHIQHWN